MKNKPSFLKSVSIILIIGIIGKILGLIKQIVIAAFFGTSVTTDLFFSSYFFVSEISIAFFSGLTIVLIPLYNKIKNKTNNENNILFSNALLFFSLFAIIIVIILLYSNSLIIDIISPGYTVEMKSELSTYIKFLSPIILFYCIQSILNSYSESEKDFLPSKISPVFLNGFLIISTVLFSKKYGNISLIIGVLLAYLIQLIVSFMRSKKYISFLWSNPLKDQNFLKMIKLFIPLFIGSAILEINSIIDRSIASSLGIGSVSAITFGASLNEIITVLIIGTFSTVFYSYVTQLVINKNNDDIFIYTYNIIKKVLIILIPIQILFIIFSKDLVSIIYMRGNFDGESVKNTTLVIIGYSLGFVFAMTRTILTKLHYSFNDTKNPMINGFITVLVNVIFSIILSKKIGIIGIPLATTISFFISTILYIMTIRKHLIFKFDKSDVLYLLKIIIIQCILFSIGLLLKKTLIFSSFYIVIASAFLIFIIYYLLLHIFKIYELEYFINKYIFKIFKKRIKH